MEEQASTRNYASRLISNGRETVSISIQRQASKLRIQKVPAFLRRLEHKKRAYDPAVVSFGPYHHGKPELKFAEDFKPTALELFVAGSGKDTDFFYNKVLEVIHDVRRCYEENSTDKYDDAVFARMMLHDACLIIVHIGIVGNHQMKFMKATKHHLGMLVHNLMYPDMILLENQIPFWFLKLLIHLKYGKDKGEKMLSQFLSFAIFGKYKQTEAGESNEEKEEPLHLLEAFRRLLVADCSNDDEIRLFWKREKINHRLNLEKYIHSFRSVADLKAKGIHFMPSPTNSLKDIKFKSWYFYGKLQLPTWIVTNNTKVFFLNMIAFEMCPNRNTDLTVSTYINFMKSLIVSPKDVKELREKKIIFNMLGSDEEVMQVYKDIQTYGVTNYPMFYEVKEKIQEHYNSKAKTWLAELIHTYFSSPWSAITLLAAVFLLCLSFLQAYFAIIPSRNQ